MDGRVGDFVSSQKHLHPILKVALSSQSVSSGSVFFDFSSRVSYFVTVSIQDLTFKLFTYKPTYLAP